MCGRAYPRYVYLAPGGGAVYAFCTPNTMGAPWIQITRLNQDEGQRITLPAMGNQAAWGNGMALSPDGSRLYVVDSEFGVNKSPSVAVLPETGGARWPSLVLILAGTAGTLVGVAIHSCRKLRRWPSASR